MNPLKVIGRLFSGLGKLILRGIKEAQARGLDDALVDHAMRLVREAALRYVDNAQRNEWAVTQLRKELAAIPESTAKLAIELALQNVKAGFAGR